MMKFLLLLTLPLMAGCDKVDEARACATGWVQFTCKYPKTFKIYEYTDVLTHRGTTLRSSQKDVWEDKGRFSLYNNTNQGKLKVAVKHLEQEDFGKYQCKLYRSNSPPYIKKWTLEAAGSCQQPSTQSVHRAAKTTITCNYPDDEQVRFLCKGESFTCEDVLSTKSPQKSNRRFTLRNTEKRFIVSISDVSSQDAGVYWCGLESKDGSYRVSVGQIKLEVTEALPTSVTHSATSSPTSTRSAAPEESFDSWPVIFAVALCLKMLMLLFVIISCVTLVSTHCCNLRG
ncbi:polymeric immunoglobulin receptor-like [Archocentrus centrarchus]|uniref:polymeric immunoglobulin receptor-like n=1 Tax=Archocentrus centrarchus TaxID=63155 RepID=UPI0011E9B863|nr:polymeric immunoglobulin receptor-like [Archocentrus centrarchus]